MRRALIAGLLLASACGGRSDRNPVALWSVDVSADRRTLTVATHYPRQPVCAKEGDGVDVDIRRDRVIVAAYAKKGDGVDYCTLECGMIVQSVTLDSPLADSVRFQAPVDADAGCGG